MKQIPENKEQPPVALTELAAHIAGLPANDAGSPHTVRLAPVNISRGGVMGAINTAVTDRYIMLDLSACKAAKNTISGSGWPGTANDMNVIQDNRYIVGIILPDSLTSIGHDTFDHCSSLVSITMLGSVTSIGPSAFEGCSSLASITIPKGVTKIRCNAFYGCSSLTSVTIPKGITSVGESSFPGDLNTKYLAAGGGAGMYTAARDNYTEIWTKQ